MGGEQQPGQVVADLGVVRCQLERLFVGGHGLALHPPALQEITEHQRPDAVGGLEPHLLGEHRLGVADFIAAGHTFPVHPVQPEHEQTDGEEAGDEAPPHLAVVADDEAGIGLAPLEKGDPLAEAEMVPVLLLAVTAAQRGDPFERSHQRPAGALHAEHVEIGLALEITHEIAEHEAEPDDEEHEQGRADEHAEQGFRSQRQGFQEPVKEIAREHEMRQRSGQGAGQQAETEEQGDVEHQVKAAHMADLMGEHTVQLLAAEVVDQGRGDEQVAQPGQDAHDAGGQHLALEQRPAEHLGAEPLGPAEADDVVAHRSRRQRPAPPEDPHERREEKHEEDDEQAEQGQLPPGRTEKAGQRRVRQELQQVEDQGKDQPGQHRGQVGLEVRPDEAAGAVAAVEQLHVAPPPLVPDNGQQEEKSRQAGDVGEHRQPVADGQRLQVEFQVEQADQAHEQPHRHKRQPPLGAEVAAGTGGRGKHPPGHAGEQPERCQQQGQGRHRRQPRFLRRVAGAEDKDGHQETEQIVVEHPVRCTPQKGETARGWGQSERQSVRGYHNH